MATRLQSAGTVLFVGVVVLSGVGGAAAIPTAASGQLAEPAGQASQESPVGTQTNAGCAATPPDDSSDPEEDVLGWENGYWYDESLAVTQADGLNDSELNATIARTMARVEFVRCLEFERTVPVDVIDRETFRQRQLARDVSPALRAFDNAKFEALFLVNETADSIAVQNENSASNVLGYYDPENDSIVVVSETTSTLRLDETTLAHELVHALQDERYNLSADHFTVRIRDDANAVAGLVEGDAQFTSLRYERRCEEGDWNGTCLSQSRPSNASLANVGIYFLKFQPYSDGPAFVQRAYAEGGWEAVNDRYDRLPTSTEQVIHVEKYGNDSETNLTVADRSTDAWTPVEPPGRPNYASVGEAGLASMFVYPTYHSEGQTQIVPVEEWVNVTESGEVSRFDPIDYGTAYSAGWDGDRLRVYRNAENETAYVWTLAWDSPEDAREFVRGYEQVLAYWGAERVGPNTYRIAEGGFADAFYVTVDESNVTVVNAPTVEGLSEVRQGIDASSGNGTDGEPRNSTAAERTPSGDNRFPTGATTGR